MSTLYRLSIDPSYSLEQAWEILEAAGIEILYGSEEENQIELFAYLPASDTLSAFKWILSSEPHFLSPIDWKTQWAIHSDYFQEGYVHINFASLGKPGATLRLEPGSGFGDLSHPTTRLMLHFLAQYLRKQIVIDIGCGSGILSLAAVVMGAPIAYGIDIDEEALQHSRQNALLNQIETQCFFCFPADFKSLSFSKPLLILMNMIRTEQQAAWSSLSSLHHSSSELLTSGIPTEEREIYLKQMTHWRWYLQDEKEEMGWLAFYFTRSK